jgi:hypothetical protein
MTRRNGTGERPITEDEFAQRILLTEFAVSPGGRFTAWYEDDDMFWGHVITVDGTLKKAPLTLIYRADNNRLQEEASIMCEHCRNIQTWRKFDAPKDYWPVLPISSSGGTR